MPDFLTRPEAANYCTEKGLKVSPATLQKMATLGGGPLYQRFGTRAVYTRPNLDAWVAEKLGTPIRSTSELPPEGRRKSSVA
jgi:hypothetical protein